MRTLFVAACFGLLLFPMACKKQEQNSGGERANGKQIIVAMMPKSKGNAYFISCRKGAEDAAKELGAKLLWDGPTDPDPAKQNEMVETWITRGVDVIAVAVENREGISTALRTHLTIPYAGFRAMRMESCHLLLSLSYCGRSSHCVSATRTSRPA